MHRRDVIQTAALGAGFAAFMRGEPARAGVRSAADFVGTSSGARLHCQDWGTGKPVLFVHSWALNSDMWAYQMPTLCDAGYRCIAYDRRGHGRSSLPGAGYDFDTLADDLAQVIDGLGLQQV